MIKLTICIGENKGAVQLRSSIFVFASQIVQFLYFLNPKFPASNQSEPKLLVFSRTGSYKCSFCMGINISKTNIDGIVLSGKHLRENVYPLKPHFDIEKTRYAGLNLFFLFLFQNINCGYSFVPPRRGGSNVYSQSKF